MLCLHMPSNFLFEFILSRLLSLQLTTLLLFSSHAFDCYSTLFLFVVLLAFVAFQEGIFGACEGDQVFMEIPASRNNETGHKGARVTNMPHGVPIDFDVEIALVVPEKAIKTTDLLLLNMRKSPDVSGKDVEEALDMGMPVNIVDTNGRTLLVTAAFTANTAAVKILLKRGADANKGEFFFSFLLLLLLLLLLLNSSFHVHSYNYLC